MRYFRIQIFSNNFQSLYKSSMMQLSCSLIVKAKPFLICLLSLVLDVPHRTNFSSLKILVLFLFAVAYVTLFLCWNAKFSSHLSGKILLFIHQETAQTSSHFLTYFHTLPTFTFFCPKLVTNPLFFLCITFYIIKRIMPYCDDLFMHLFPSPKFKFSNV